MSVQKNLLRQARVSGLALFFNVIGGMITAIFIILQAYILSEIIVAVFSRGQDLQSIFNRIYQLAIIIGIRALVVFFNEISAKSIAAKVKSHLRLDLIQKVSRRGPFFLGIEKHGSILNTIYEGVESLDAYYSQYLPQVILSVLVPLTILIAIFPLEPLSGLILLITAPLIPIFMALIGIMTEERTKKQWQILNKLSTRFFDTLQSLNLIRLLNREKEQEKTLQASDQAYRNATMGVLRYTFLSAFTLELVATISTAIVAVEIGLRLIYGKLDFLPALFILVLTPEFYLPLRQLGVKYHAAMTGIEAAGDIYKLLEMPESQTIHKPEPAQWTGEEIFPISFVSVSARYPGETKLAANQINFSINKGEKIALVGPSGAGKTTITSLLLRFIKPFDGQIVSVGTPLNQIPVEYWRENIAWVPQNPHLFSGTIARNVALSSETIDFHKLEDALSASESLHWVHNLPDGWNTQIGERGYGISTGQIQRIAIARAFYKDAPLLILDEPTSALDPLLESELYTAIKRLVSNRTVITIAHRLPTIFQSDRIFFINDGKISETGTHIELVNLGQEYAKFVRNYQYATE